ncbi:MAG: hypothetical protein ACR2QE_18445 [Acidimicrobiales bacterium]
MNSVAPNASDGLFAADEEMKRWQRVEAEAWGITPPAEQSVITTEVEEEKSSRPIAFVALLALVVFAGLWLYTHEFAASTDTLAAKAVVAPAVAREVPTPCAVIGELRAVQGDAYVRLLGQDDDVQRLAILAEQSRAEVRILDQLLEVEPALTMSAAPVRFRSQLIADGIGGVESGQATLAGLLAEADEMGPQAAAGEKAIGVYQTEQCGGS